MLLLFLTFNTLSDLFTNVTDDTILKLLKVINLYTKISKDNIRSKYMVLSYFFFLFVYIYIQPDCFIHKFELNFFYVICPGLNVQRCPVYFHVTDSRCSLDRLSGYKIEKLDHSVPRWRAFFCRIRKKSIRIVATTICQRFCTQLYTFPAAVKKSQSYPSLMSVHPFLYRKMCSRPDGRNVFRQPVGNQPSNLCI